MFDFRWLRKTRKACHTPRSIHCSAESLCWQGFRGYTPSCMKWYTRECFYAVKASPGKACRLYTEPVTTLYTRNPFRGLQCRTGQGIALGILFSVSGTRYQHLTLLGVMDKITVMAAPRHPASASRPRNKLRARSPLSFASLLSEWFK